MKYMRSVVWVAESDKLELVEVACMNIGISQQAVRASFMLFTQSIFNLLKKDITFLYESAHSTSIFPFLRT